AIVINTGHGNGWPSPYATWQPYTKDGLGLNPVDTTSDNTTTQYHREFYLAQNIRLAPNAIVLLNHLCYSAGNSEPGLPEPTVGVAHQRLDNFAAGWLRTGARAVISEAYHGAVEEVRALFTTRQTIDQLWRGMSDANGNVVTFPSVRTTWASAMSGPDLTPRDSTGPNVWTADDGSGAFSPNGDGRQDTLGVSGRFSETVTWSAAFQRLDGSVLRTVAGTGNSYDATWDGKVAGSPA